MSNDNNQIAGVIAFPPLIFAAFLAGGLLVHLIYPVDISKSAWFALRYAGVMMLAVSGVLALWASRTMRRENTPVSPGKPTTAIVTAGPFRYTRNPMYVSLMLLYGGIALMMNSSWIIVLIAAMYATFDRGVVRREERYLEQKFGEEYLRYKGNVRRWI